MFYSYGQMVILLRAFGKKCETWSGINKDFIDMYCSQTPSDRVLSQNNFQVN